MNPKISIIVPVYKVEKYIHRCIESILAQTFTEFELILVDDGSPDRCGLICDDYASKDSRIRVIHKRNGGLADARNAGLDIARGDYIGFVDSDDWIETDMYELLYKMCIENDCDIASCTSIIEYPNKNVINGTHSFKIHQREEAMKVMLEGELYDEVVWTKLFRRSLLKDIRFPVGKTYEDTAFTYRVIHKSKRVCCVGEPKYHYIKREDSMMDTAVKNIKIDAVEIYNDMHKFLSEYYPSLKSLVTLKLANSAMGILNLISFSEQPWRHSEKYDKVVDILNKHFSTTIKLKEYPSTVKVLLLATKLHPSLYRTIVTSLSKRRGA